MRHIVRKLGVTFGLIRDPVPEAHDDELVERAIARVRSANPNTTAQWLRLERSLAAQATRVSKQPSHKMVPRIAFASAAVVAVLVAGYFVFTPPPVDTDTFTTGRGEQKRVALQDGSELILSHSSHLVVTRMQKGKPRMLSLAGEAFFRVRKSETPFVVSTDAADVQVVGTEFNIRARDKSTEVAVTSGTVNVRPSHNAAAEPLLLSTHQMVLVSAEKGAGAVTSTPSPEYPGWLQGKLFLDRALFEDACREIELRFDVTIVIADQKVRAELITGVLDARTPESALAALCGLVGREFSYEYGEYRVR
jgi:transmembrane sensor